MYITLNIILIISFYCTGRDLIAFVTAFIACLIFDVELGLLIGIGVDLLLVLYRNARPSITIDKDTVRIKIFTITRREQNNGQESIVVVYDFDVSTDFYGGKRKILLKLSIFLLKKRHRLIYLHF